AEAAPAMTNCRRSILTLHSSDRLHRSLDALCVRIPESLELRLVQIGDDIADVRDRCLELFAVGDLLRLHTHPRDHWIGRALRREQADPDRELDVVAELLEC